MPRPLAVFSTSHGKCWYSKISDCKSEEKLLISDLTSLYGNNPFILFSPMCHLLSNVQFHLVKVSHGIDFHNLE